MTSFNFRYFLKKSKKLQFWQEGSNFRVTISDIYKHVQKMYLKLTFRLSDLVHDVIEYQHFLKNQKNVKKCKKYWFLTIHKYSEGIEMANFLPGRTIWAPYLHFFKIIYGHPSMTQNDVTAFFNVFSTFRLGMIINFWTRFGSVSTLAFCTLYMWDNWYHLTIVVRR